MFALIFSLAACGTQSPGSDTKQSATNAQSLANTTDSSNSSTGKKAVVVYFSGSGNTKRVAELVANETGAAILELVPKNPYTEDDLNWRDENSRVQKEHNDTSLQNIELKSTAVPDWESYDTVLFGYPL